MSNEPTTIEITSPDQFHQSLWKNGKGKTTQLAISSGHDLTNFDWRLSIASVVENGAFSNFTGYHRHLVLLQGNGMSLDFGSQQSVLRNSLDFAVFDGGSTTTATLHDGDITDFNLMTRTGRYEINFKTYKNRSIVPVENAELVFCYGTQSNTMITSQETNHSHILPMGHLLKMGNTPANDFLLSGDGLIVIHLNVM